MQTQHRSSHAVRSPFQPHPALRRAQETAMDMQNPDNPVRGLLAKLCQQRYTLTASFSADTSVMSAVKTPGLIAVKCELSMAGHGVVGIGHGSTAISRLNKGIDRALYGALNGALMSAINGACKTLDVIRLDGPEALGEAYRLKDAAEASEPATDKQKSYLRELILLNCEDDTDRHERLNGLNELTKQEASRQIQMLAR